MADTENAYFSTADDRLPIGQKVIETSGVKKLRRFMKLLLENRVRTGYSKMGVITGKAGLGKTIAVQAFVDEFQPRAHTGLPAVIKVRLKPELTSKALALVILEGLEEKPRGRNRYEIQDEVAAAIRRNQMELLIVDEGDLLNDVSFDFLRHLHDTTGLPIVIVGLPTIWLVIKSQEKFESRVGLQMEFPSPTRDEVVNVVLPQLSLPHWSFDPNNESDIKMGERIFEIVGTSYRRLRMLLDAASQIAAIDDAPRITLAIIEEAIGWTPPQNGAASRIQPKGPKRRPPSSQYERLSEQRHAARPKKRG